LAAKQFPAPAGNCATDWKAAQSRDHYAKDKNMQRTASALWNGGLKD
jgi:hypothetical protein